MTQIDYRLSTGKWVRFVIQDQDGGLMWTEVFYRHDPSPSETVEADAALDNIMAERFGCEPNGPGGPLEPIGHALN